MSDAPKYTQRPSARPEARVDLESYERELKAALSSAMQKYAGDNLAPSGDNLEYMKFFDYKEKLERNLNSDIKEIIVIDTEDYLRQAARSLVRTVSEDCALNLDDAAQEQAVREIAQAAEVVLFRKPQSTPPAAQEPPPLPDKAPKLYADRPKGQNVIDFLRETYGPWLDGTLTRPALRQLDPQCYMALANWLRMNSLPQDILLPTKRETIDRALEDTERLRAAERLVRANQRRHRRPME